MNRLASALSVAVTAAVFSGCAQSSLQHNAFAPTAASFAPRAVAETILHSFGKGYDGAYPYAELVAVKGVFYGTTSDGGKNGTGTVFSIDAQGREKTLHSFGNANGDGQSPHAGLVYVNGTLYGVTGNGGANATGAVFSITTAGAEKVLYSFGPADSTDGSAPYATLLYADGALYGTTLYGGESGQLGLGTLFSVTLDGKEKVLHAFGGGSDGFTPEAQLVDVKGTLYGTTAEAEESQGALFKISPSGSGYKVLHYFDPDTAGPSGLIYENGLLYGVTGGGVNAVGTFYSSTLSGQVKKLYELLGDNGLDVIHPFGAIAYAHGYFYLAGGQGGSGSHGGIARITATGKENVLYSFGVTNGVLNPKDGMQPGAGPIYYKNDLYGTTQWGGVNPFNGEGGGTVYKIHP